MATPPDVTDGRNAFARSQVLRLPDHPVAALGGQTSCRRCGALLPFAGPEGSCMRCLLDLGFEETGENPGAEELPETPPPKAVAVVAPRRCFGHYEVAVHADGTTLWELGRGSMGVTFRAVDTVLHYAVALKVVDASAAAHPEARARFLREARAAAQLRHPNVAGVFHFGETATHCFYAMELVEGETLEARVRRDGPLSPELTLEVATQVTRALAAAEGRGLVHRDLKPANVMLVAGADTLTVKVIDFGLAKAVAAAARGEVDLTHGGFVGTPTFASPEQFAVASGGGGDAKVEAATTVTVDTRSDIYSLGVTLWFLLTGKVPFAGRTLAEIRDRQVHAPLPTVQLEAARVPKPLAELLHAMLATNPADRPQSASELVTALRRCRERMDGATAAPGRRRRLALAGTLALLVVGLAVAVGYFLPRPDARNTATAAPSDKSIAVLPFENLSEEPGSIFFADGIQDDVITNLSRVADLKVISRTSVMGYRRSDSSGAGVRNLREIGQALGVAHVLEGSVRRAGNKVRVSAQLINAQTDAHLWAETFDREVNDLFALQSELAERIVAALRVNLSPGERACLQRRPTADLEAYDLYLHARELYQWQGEGPQRENWEKALRLAGEAVARDPQFALAHSLISLLHDDLYWFDHDKTPARLAQAKAAVDTALRLQPDLGEAHLALAYHHYHGFRDYDRARAELDLARRTLPNDAAVLAATAYLDRRQGRWEESVANLERASELDPRNLATLWGLVQSYQHLRRYPDAQRALDRGLALSPKAHEFRLTKAWIALDATGDVGPLRTALQVIPADYDPDGKVTLARLHLSLATRNHAEAARVLAAAPPERFGDTPKPWFEGLVSRMRGDLDAARTAFTAARRAAEADLARQPDEAKTLSFLGLVDAVLGRKDEAIREGRRATELLPVAKDAVDGMGFANNLAMIYAQTGERDLAFAELTALVKLPGGPDLGALRVNLLWDPLRGDPRFEKLLAEMTKASPRLSSGDKL